MRNMIPERLAFISKSPAAQATRDRACPGKWVTAVLPKEVIMLECQVQMESSCSDPRIVKVKSAIDGKRSRFY